MAISSNWQATAFLCFYSDLLHIVCSAVHAKEAKGAIIWPTEG
jgi:hypothetical protein